jgi:YegS/Rv2252/BmrU family lipid kinase
MWYIIVNPTAGGGAARRLWPTLEGLLQELRFPYTVQFSAAKGHAAQLAENAVERGHRQILGVGGDGTHHEIVNGILQQKATSSDSVQYALLPVGTGNDWARMYGLSCDPRTRLIQLQNNPAPRWQDVGLIEYERAGQRHLRYFANVAGFAYDAYVVHQIEKRTRPLRSRLHYLWAVGQHLMDYQPQRGCILMDDGTEIKDRFYTINVGICKYSGGGMQFVPHAVPDDGLLALTAARNVSKIEVLMQMPRFYNGTLLQHPRIQGWQARSIRVEADSDGPLLIEADGEFLGHTPADITLLEKALCFL